MAVKASGGRVEVKLRSLHPQQMVFINSKAKRKVIRAGRRSGKTVGASQLAVKVFFEGKRVLYAVPVAEQVEAFWFEVKQALRELIDAKLLKINETDHSIERVGTKQRIRAKTAWNADTLRGDFADLLILDEFQLMNEDAWEEVGAPMLLDNNGDAVFIYTPVSLHTRTASKAKDPLHASKMFRAVDGDMTGRWQTFHFTSHDNPWISSEALGDITRDMSQQSIRREILAEDDEQDAKRLVYSVFREDSQLIEPFSIPKTWPRLVGHDFGTVNPAALFVAQNPGPTIAHGMLQGDFVLYEPYFPGPGLSTADHVEAFKALTAGLEVARRVGGNKNTEEEIRQGYGALGWPISAPRWSQPSVQIDRVIGLMEKNKIFVFKTAYRLREELANCLWAVDNEGEKLDKVENEARYHLLAALRYVMSDMSQESAISATEYATVQDMRPSKQDERLFEKELVTARPSRSILAR